MDPSLPAKYRYTDAERRAFARKMNDRKNRRRGVAQSLLPPGDFPSFSTCGVPCDTKFQRTDEITLSISDGGIAHVQEKCCNGTLICPVCAPRRLREMADEVAELIDQAIEKGLSLYLVTHTIPHEKTDFLDPLLAELNAALHSAYSSESWRLFKDEFGYQGYVRSFEVTYGANGWNPHFHNLIFFSGSPKPEEMKNLLFAAYSQWVKQTTGKICSKKAFDVTRVNSSNAADYISKAFLSFYLSKQSKSGSIMPFDLLDLAEEEKLCPPYETIEDLRDGVHLNPHDYDAAELWCEYAFAVKGKSRIRFSKGLRESLSEFDIDGRPEPHKPAYTLMFPAAVVRLFADEPILYSDFLNALDEEYLPKILAICDKAREFIDRPKAETELTEFCSSLIFYLTNNSTDDELSVEFEEIA